MDRLAAIRDAYRKQFGGTPELWARAPGRVDLMGSHTDYNLGLVLTMPISRDTCIAATPRAGARIRAYSMNLDSGLCIDLDRLGDRQNVWGDYIAGVAGVFKSEGLAVRGFDAVVHSTVPIGSGLSSSAALECATAVVLKTLGGWDIEPARMARLCQRAENEFVGVNCGILDQFTSCLGRESCALLLDCRTFATNTVAISDNISIVICDTRTRRELSGSEYGIRRRQCEQGAALLGVQSLRDASIDQVEACSQELPSDVVKRCRFIIEEIARVPALAEALGVSDRARIARLCSASFAGASELYEIASPSMHAMMRAMLSAPGAIGARQAGAGFGGCMVALVEAGREGEFAHDVREFYRVETGMDAEIYPVQAAAGAGLFGAGEEGKYRIARDVSAGA